MGRLSPFKKFLIVVGALIVLELGYLLFFAISPLNQDARDVIKEALQRSKGGENIERQVQIAVQMYRGDNNGKLPDNLGQLVPKYLATQPIDPQTRQPLAYRIEGDKFYVGNGGTAIVMTKEGGKTTVVTGQAAAEEMNVQMFLKALSEPPNARLAHYDPANKRDPFRPFDLSARTRLDVARSPLQSLDLKELALTAVVEQGDEARALIESSDGQGHTVKKGDKIGLHDGEVVEIHPDRVVVLESMQDFTGETKTKTIEILRKGQIKKSGSAGKNAI